MTTRLSPAFFLFLMYSFVLVCTMRPHASQFDAWNNRAVPMFLEMQRDR